MEFDQNILLARKYLFSNLRVFIFKFQVFIRLFAKGRLGLPNGALVSRIVSCVGFAIKGFGKLLGVGRGTSDSAENIKAKWRICVVAVEEM